MEENIKVSYEQIQKANEEMTKTDIKGSDYAPVNERIKAYRKVYPTGSIITKIEEVKDDYVRIRVEVTDEQDRVIATGTASETLTGDAKKDYINKTSMIENCETSAAGRALGFAGFGVDKAVASAEDIERNKENSKRFEIAKGVFVKESDAILVVKNSINDLCRKMGLVKAELESKVNEQLWTDLKDLNLSQCQRLESKLKTINMESDDWHDLYNKNLRIKEVVPINQEVVYESSWSKFGKIALQMAGTDETKRNEIIDDYLNMGIDLSKGE